MPVCALFPEDSPTSETSAMPSLPTTMNSTLPPPTSFPSSMSTMPMSSPTAISYQPTTSGTAAEEQFTEQMAATDGMEEEGGADFEERNGIRRWVARIRRQTTMVPIQETTKAPPMASLSMRTKLLHFPHTISAMQRNIHGCCLRFAQRMDGRTF